MAAVVLLFLVFLLLVLLLLVLLLLLLLLLLLVQVIRNGPFITSEFLLRSQCYSTWRWWSRC